MTEPRCLYYILNMVLPSCRSCSYLTVVQKMSTLLVSCLLCLLFSYC